MNRTVTNLNVEGGTMIIVGEDHADCPVCKCGAKNFRRDLLALCGCPDPLPKAGLFRRCVRWVLNLIGGRK